MRGLGRRIRPRGRPVPRYIWQKILTNSHLSAILIMDYGSGGFVWDVEKEAANIRKHGIDFVTAARAFDDPGRKLYADSAHSREEPRLFCIGRIGDWIVTVRFVCRHGRIRIFGAGCWRKGMKLYETQD